MTRFVDLCGFRRSSSLCALLFLFVPGGVGRATGAREVCAMRVWLRVAGAYRRNRYVSGDNLETECSVAVRARRENRTTNRRGPVTDVETREMGRVCCIVALPLGCNCVPCVCPVDLDKTTHAPRRDELESLRRHSLGAPTAAAIDPPHTVARWAAAPHSSHTNLDIYTRTRAHHAARHEKPVSIHCLLALAHSLSGRLL